MTARIAAGAGLLAMAGAACGGSGGVTTAALEVRHSRFSADSLEARVGQPLRLRLHNADPIDHEWIVGDEAIHRRHATGTEPRHDERPTEVTLEALTTRTTTITFDAPGRYRFVCHLPGHEAYGMTGVVTVR